MEICFAQFDKAASLLGYCVARIVMRGKLSGDTVFIGRPYTVRAHPLNIVESHIGLLAV